MKRSLTVFLFAMLAAFFTMGAGCQSTGGGTVSTEQAAAGSCLAAAAALDALVIANDAGKLSVSQQNAVSLADAKISIICLDENPPTLDSLRQAALAEAVRSLTDLQESTR